MTITRLTILVAVSLAAVAAIHGPAFAAPPAPDEFEKAVWPYVAEYCARCHDAKKQKGEFRLDTLSRDFAAGGSTMK